MSEQRIRFGANYVPSKYWWYSWLDWDPLSIAGDLQALARLNLDHIRIHCLWPVFQPNANWVSQTAVSRLQELLNIADDNGLDVCITVLNGWLSGFNFLPTWKNDRNLFSDPAGIVGENRRYHLPLLRSQAVLAQWDGDTVQAAANLQSALALAQDSGLPCEAYSILGALGALYAQQGSQAQAQQSYKAAAAIIMPAAVIVSDQPVCVVIPIITTGTAIKSR